MRYWNKDVSYADIVIAANDTLPLLDGTLEPVRRIINDTDIDCHRWQSHLRCLQELHRRRTHFSTN